MRKARVQAEEFPAFRPASPCGRHFFGTLSETKPVPEDHRAPRHCLLPGIRPAALPDRYRPASLRSRRLRMISYPIAPSSVAVIMISASALIVGVIPVRTLEKT